MTLNHIKPHGSLYGMAARMEEMAHAVCDAADVFKVPLMGMINTCHEKVYPARGHKFIAEFYADLDYRDDGASSSPASMRPRTRPMPRRSACAPSAKAR